MAKRTRNILLFTLLLFLAGTALAYYFYNKGPVDIQEAAAQKINAGELYSAFLSDSLSAQKKYSGRILMVEGTVAQSSFNQNGQQLILLQTGASSGFVNCTLDQKMKANIQPGQLTLIKGICSGLGDADEITGLQPDLYLERCIVQP